MKKNLIIACLFLTTFSSFLPSLKNGFVNWEDDTQLYQNPFTRGLSLDNIKNIFTTAVAGKYNPLATLSFVLEHQFFGDNPFIYHFDNLLLHLAVTFLVFVFAQQLQLTVGAAALAALLFGIHPQHVESVAWVSGRADILCSLFYMLALCSYGKYSDRQDKKIFYILSVVSGVLSVLAGGMALSLPFILFLYDWYRGRKLAPCVFLEKIPYFIFIIPVALIAYAAQGPLIYNDFIRPFLIRVWILIFYLKTFISPSVLVPINDFPVSVSIFNVKYAMPVLILILIFAALIVWRRRRFLVFAFVFFFLSVAPIFCHGLNFTVYRLLYFSTIGFCLVFGIFVAAAFAQVKTLSIFMRGLFIFFLFLFLSTAFSKTSAQCKVWKNSISLWVHQLNYYPHTPLALNNLAVAYGQQEGYDREVTIGLYKKAIENAPFFIDAHYNLANLYRDVLRDGEAIAEYLNVLQLSPNYKEAYYNLGGLFSRVNRPQEAVAFYKKLIALDSKNEDAYIKVVKAYNELVLQQPAHKSIYEEARKEIMALYRNFVDAGPKDAVAYFHLGFAYNESGDDEQAIDWYQKAAALNPKYAKAFYNLGNIYRDRADYARAIEFYEKAVQCDPRHSDAFLNLGVIYGERGDVKKGIDFYQKALQADPKNSNAYFNLGFAFESLKQFNDAIISYKKAIEADPKHIEAYYNLGNVYANLGRETDAVFCYQKAIELNPSHMDALVNLSVVCFRNRLFKEAIKYCDSAIEVGYKAPDEYLKALEEYR